MADNTDLGIYSLVMGQADQLESPKMNEDECAPCYIFTFRSPVHFFHDLDGIRAFTRNAVHTIQPVCAQSKAVLGLGSNEPGAILFNAYLKLEQRSYVAYEFIRSISAENMLKAVDDCLVAAAHNFDPKMQKKLLKAASMGLHRCDRPYDSDKLMSTNRQLRVLNALRMLGIPLTIEQMHQLGPSSVVDRLVALGHWPMAIEICNFLDFEPKNGVYKVLAHWCLTMMVTHKSKNKRNEGGSFSVDKLAQRIIGRLSKYSAISYADIAEMATRQELHDLANILLDKEKNISRQVTVMLKMKQLERALKKAAQSQQPDLMHLVLKHLRHGENATDVELLLRKVPQAWSIYQSEIRNEAPDRLLALYEQNDDFVRQAIVYLMKAEQCHDIFDHSKIIEHLSKAERALRSMKDVSSAQLVSESVHLITENIKREEKYGMSMSHLSVRDTFILAAGHEEMSLMEQLKKQHRLNEKQIFLWTIEGFARAQKWQQLEQFVRFKKNPTLGNLPVIELCASHGNKNLALRFMDGINGYEEQIQAYLILGEVRKAATLAMERADVHMLQSIRRGFPTTSPHWTEVTKMMEDLIKNR